MVVLGGCAWLLGGGCAWDKTRYGDTVNERAVCILLECILVQRCKNKILNGLKEIFADNYLLYYDNLSDA